MGNAGIIQEAQTVIRTVCMTLFYLLVVFVSHPHSVFTTWYLMILFNYILNFFLFFNILKTF